MASSIGKQYVVVKLLNVDESEDRRDLCEFIVANAEDVDFAYPAVDDGFGRLVMDGHKVRHQTIDGTED